ncbi:MAG: class I SAM-dependent methyltransferase [Bacteroidales bacterium]|nr:class I SAM-dependent methyltransferase [Bacteroidales bacterium]
MAYLCYFFRARHRKGHGIHSPFMYDFVANVMNDSKKYQDYCLAEDCRKILLKDNTLIEVVDFGAGSRAHNSRHRTVASIARNASITPKYGRILYRMARYYQQELIIELGTSLGIGTHYLAAGNPDAKVITVEGDPSLAAMAAKWFSQNNLKNVTVINNTFEKALPALIPESPCTTMIFIDGNHSYAATLEYTRFFLAQIPDGSLVIFDDINWSDGMRKAWKEIREDRKSSITIDLFHMGIVIKNDQLFKENYTIRF